MTNRATGLSRKGSTRLAALSIAPALTLASATGCADGRKAPAVLPASHRTHPSVFVVVGGRESTGSGLRDPLHTSWSQIVFADQFPIGTVYVNLAHNDTTVAQAVTQQGPLAIEQRPTVAAVWLGEGDDDVATPPAQFGRALRNVLGQLRTRGATRVLVTSPPPGVPGAQYAPQIAEAARNTGAEVVALSAAAWDPRARGDRQQAVQAEAAREIADALKK